MALYSSAAGPSKEIAEVRSQIAEVKTSGCHRIGFNLRNLSLCPLLQFGYASRCPYGTDKN